QNGTRGCNQRILQHKRVRLGEDHRPQRVSRLRTLSVSRTDQRGDDPLCGGQVQPGVPGDVTQPHQAARFFEAPQHIEGAFEGPSLVSCCTHSAPRALGSVGLTLTLDRAPLTSWLTPQRSRVTVSTIIKREKLS